MNAEFGIKGTIYISVVFTMPKNKHKRIERVKHLPNVFFSDQHLVLPSFDFPWQTKPQSDKPIVLELGCGKGEHTLAFAQNDKTRLFVGMDVKSHRLCVGAEQALSEGLGNVYFIQSRIEKTDRFFNKNSIHEIWLTFPDPHPKRQNIKSRLTSPLFLDLYAKLLIPGGRIILKTDSDLLYSYTKESVSHWDGDIIEAWDNIHQTPNDLIPASHVSSAFEKKALAKSLAIKSLIFTLK